MVLDLGQPEYKSHKDWPNLTSDMMSDEKSATDDGYNCIALAADKRDAPWWPAAKPYYWPAGIPMEETLGAFVAAYALMGYEECESCEPEEGVEKIALYADDKNVPTHAARWSPDKQLWLSKLGDLKDIEHHSLEALEDGRT